MENKIGKKIKELREKQELTTTELAEKSGVSQSTISQIENGKRNASTGTVVKIAEALGVSITEIVKSSSIEENKDNDTKDDDKNLDNKNVFIIENDKIMVYTPKNYVIKGKKSNIIINVTVENVEKDDKQSNKNFFTAFHESIATRIIQKFIDENKDQIVDEINQQINTERKKLNELLNKKEDEI